MRCENRKTNQNKPKTNPKNGIYYKYHEIKIACKENGWKSIFWPNFYFVKKIGEEIFSISEKWKKIKKVKSAIFWHKIFNFFSKNENWKFKNGLIYWYSKFWKMSIGDRKGILVNRKDFWWSTFLFSPISLIKKLFFWKNFFGHFHLFSL